MPIAQDQYIVQTKGNLVSQMDGQLVMMNINNGKYYNLGAIGGRIWELIESSTPLSQIYSVLLSEYDVDLPTLERQVQTFLQSLLQEGLIQITEDANS